MSICALYIDEAGSPQRHHIPVESGETPLFVLGGITLPLSHWRDFDRDYLNLKRTFFTTEMEVKRNRPEHWEAKGNDLAAPRNRTSDKRHAFINEFITLLQRWQCALFGVCFLKNHETPTSAVSLYTMGLQQIAEKYSTYLSEHSQYDNGVMILDSRCRGPQGQDFQVASSHMSYVFGHETGRQLTNLVEAPLFADSRLTAGLQTADIMMSLYYGNQYYYYLRDSIPNALDYSHLQKYWASLDAMQFKSRKQYSGYDVFGFRKNDYR